MSIAVSSSTPSLQTISKKALQVSVKGIPLYVYAVSLASLFTVIGILWDISWHTTIGRDKFLSPPHLLIYIGAIFAGLFSGVQVLWNTFKATPETKKGLVKIWGFFYSSLGALFCIWGAIAMLTSAPFDDWWHNAYGLDVVILSPPHSLLALGMLFLQFGACVSISKYLNRVENDVVTNSMIKSYWITNNRKQKTILRILFLIASASLLCMLYTLLTQFIDRRAQHAALFFQVATAVAMLLLPVFGRVLRIKWGMTAVALGYFFIAGGANWILQLFPAVPKLGPILNPVTHYQSLQFPLMVFIPAIGMDLVLQKVMKNDWIIAAVMTLVFVVVLIAVQYPFSGFLVESTLARNWFFGSDAWYYGANPDWEFRYKYRPEEIQPFPEILSGALIATLIGFFLARLSLRWGKWMQSIQR
ncbi:MAG: hypothetical protein M3040_10580 [Bacteroidota bacterium]|nr:hypothetical protein [Bacteroidota bacterium]